uniref:CCHC-type domain-containing protein n=1 Tax=Nicotiana tabacum TaxID=4097 RepID=A0A1S3Y6P9_TOBAC|nr:PREDICTED: uncharacterized protein LOC107772959 [Nicotiana tabacum]
MENNTANIDVDATKYAAPSPITYAKPFPDVSKIEEAKEIWESMIIKYTAEDATKQKFVIGNYYNWEMTEDKDITAQINEYHKLIEDLKYKDISLQNSLLLDLVKHIIIENTNCKQVVVDKGKEIATRANLMEDNKRQNKSNNMYDKRNGYKPTTNNRTFKKKGNCFVCGKSGHHATQCRKRARNDNPAKAKVNIIEAKADDIIIVVVFQVNLVANVKDWVLDSGATRHMYTDKKDFVSYSQVEKGEEVVYLGDSRTTPVLGKDKVLLKITSSKTLALNDVLHVPNIRANLVYVGY